VDSQILGGIAKLKGIDIYRRWLAQGLLLRLCRLVCSLLCCLLCSLPCPAQLNREEDLKAALILSFVRFTEWPNPTTPDAPLVIGVYGQEELQHSLQQLAQGKTVQGRPIQVRGIRYAADVKQCQLIHFGSHSSKQVEELLLVARDLNVLTVGESDRFLSSGGLIHVFQQDGRLQFEVHMGALDRAKLSISSKLLRLGYVVKSADGGKGRP
jgi:hypothetical protein